MHHLRKFIFVWGIGLLIVMNATPVHSRSLNYRCLGAWLGETLVPGAGYLYLGHYDKAAAFGIPRWWASSHANYYRNHEDYQDDPEEIYKEGEGDEEGDLHVYLNKETFLAEQYGSISSNLWMISSYDLYETECGENPDTYQELLSPLRFDRFGAEWTFWTPTSLALIGGQGSESHLHVEKGLHADAMLRDLTLRYYLVGLGEEMVFRGVIQRGFFEVFSRSISKPMARWSSIALASAMFGLAHTGTGNQASAIQAALAGVYLGWIYHPADGEFDLEQAVAVHSWWDMIQGYYEVRHGKFDRSLYIPLAQFQFQF